MISTDSLNIFQEICDKHAFDFYECIKVHGRIIGGSRNKKNIHFYETHLINFLGDKNIQKIIREDLFPNGNNGNYGLDKEVIIYTPFNKLVFKGWLQAGSDFEMEILDKEE